MKKMRKFVTGHAHVHVHAHALVREDVDVIQNHVHVVEVVEGQVKMVAMLHKVAVHRLEERVVALVHALQAHGVPKRLLEALLLNNL